MNKSVYMISAGLVLAFLAGLSLFALRVYDAPAENIAEAVDTVAVYNNVTYG